MASSRKPQVTLRAIRAWERAWEEERGRAPTAAEADRARLVAVAVILRQRGYSLRSIADILGRSAGWVHSVTTARAKLSASDCRKSRSGRAVGPKRPRKTERRRAQ